ncbi:patatin-like phospholipase family protein [Fulvivirga lutea]|uniref:Patatin-like phospholipase family protein n=1 Tax=Fulvivirga lutea TaxID=2810512 RepID=A0A974WHI3_9BACT|nr:patatin-like phospholipase family protein [Fulvivirga lutea]QSE98220.1 patatin-like phospholipase family protein [Fulvivirga lutea]
MATVAQSQKVALVMSGGGAKGIAHVGVIKALEEHNIPIDYVVGTSMGGVVAGIYAAGYSAAQVENIMLSPSFLKWVNGEFEPGYKYYLYQDKPNSSFVSLKLSLDSTFNATVNSSLASDITLNFALPEYLSRASAVAGNNFDSLFVPARIIAADVFTQTEMALKNASLPLALRTTLSVPFFYKPIKIDDKYLFDGGIYNNFPVDVAQREFHPDVIIGSNVASKIFNKYPYEDDDKLINNSLLFMLLDKSDPTRIPEDGVYIEPDLTDYTAFDFSKAKALIDSGYNATINQMDSIKKRIEKRVYKEARKKEREQFHERETPFSFNQINFHGYNSKQRKYIRKLFRFEEGQELTLEDIKRGYFKMVSEDYFSSVFPDVKFDKTTKNYSLELYGRPKNNLNVQIGGAIATRNISQIYFGSEFYYFDNYLLKNSVSFYAGGFYKSAQLRSRLYLTTKAFPFYLEPEFVYNSWDYLNSDDIFIDDDAPTILDRADRRYALNLGIPVGNRFKAVFSGAFINNDDEYGNNLGITSTDTLDVLGLTGFRGGVSFGRDNFDEKQYPKQGKSLKISADFFALDEEYIPGTTSVNGFVKDYHEWFRVSGRWEQYFKAGKFSTGYIVEGAYSSQKYLSNYLGTLINLPSFNPLQDSRTLLLQNFRAYSYGALGIRNVLAITSNLDFRLEGYVFKPFERLNIESGRLGRSTEDLEQIYLAGTSGLVLKSPIGPISVSVNYYDDAENQWGALLHVGFLLYNNNSLGN